MGLRNGILIRIRKKHIRIGNKFDCVEGVRKQGIDKIVAFGVPLGLSPFLGGVESRQRVSFPTNSMSVWDTTHSFPISRESQSGKGYAEELLLQPRYENIRVMMEIRQDSSSAPLTLSGSVNCVSASSLQPPPPSDPSVGCGVGTALPNGVARCVLDAHPDKQVRALVPMTTLIQQYNALEEAVTMSARAQLHRSASPNPSCVAVDDNSAEVSYLIDILVSLLFNFQVTICEHVVVVS